MDIFANGFSFEILLDLLRRRIWIAVTLFCVIFTAAVSLLLFLPNIYTAKAVILIEGQSIPTHFVSPTVTIGAERRLQSISQDLLSRSRLEKMTEEFGLYRDLKQKGAAGEAIAIAMRQDIGIRSTNRGGVIGGGGGDAMAFEVNYTSPDPEKAMQVANKLASDYIEENMKIRERVSLGTTGFLQQQLDEAKKRLEVHEQQVMLYKKQHLGELPEQLDANLRTLDVLQKQMGTISENLARARERHSALAQMAEVDAALSSLDTLTSVAGKSNQNLASLQSQLAQLKVRFSDKHPDVMRLKNLIGSLEEEEKKQTQNDSLDLALPVPSLQSVSSVQIEQAEASAEIQSLTADLSRITREIALYKQRIENTAKREQELLKMTRDYESTSELYKSLLKRHEEASIADNMEKEQRAERFRLLEPAAYPKEPSAPQRPRFFFVALALSLGAAVGGVFLREIVDTSFHRVDDLKRFVKIPVLVAIPQIITNSDRRRRRLYNGFGVVVLVTSLILLVNVSYRIASGNEQLVRSFGSPGGGQVR
jgi:polysaccharide chain length determinant protein (PEP-CTERM system associated)